MSEKNSMLEQVEGDRPADGLAPGAGADGMPKMLTLDEAAQAIGERDADEEAFAKLLPGYDADLDEEDLDDVSDLDDDEEVE